MRVTDSITIGESELDEDFVRSSGPGGQNVNKLATAVQLRFDVRRSPSLPNDVAVRLMRLAGSRLTKDGVDPVGNTPAEFSAQIARELVQWRDLVRAANIKAE